MPFLRWRHQLTRDSLRGDLLAGVSVALVMIPQSLAYAQLAGFPAHYGLYAAMLPSLVAALFGSSAQLSTGPVALTGMLTAASIAPFAAPGSEAFIALGVLLALLAGLIQLALGALRQGWVLNLLSRPVFAGFINAAALLICLSQLPALLGIRGPHAAAISDEIARIGQALSAPHLPTLAFGGLSLATLIAFARFAPRWPGVLIVAVVGTLVSAHTGFESLGGAVVGHIPATLPPLSLPALPAWSQLSGLLPAAFVLALVSFLEAASSCKPIAERTRQSWDENQELIGQGLAKLAAAFSNTLPTSGSFSRSALSYSAGARSGMAQVIAVAVLVAATLSLSHTLYHLPNAVLAAIIVHAIVRLLDFHTLRRAWRIDADDGLAATATFVATLVFAPRLQNGILTGLLLSLSLLIWRSMKPRVALLGLHPDATYRDLDRFGLAHPHPALVVLRFDGPLHFVNAARFTEAVNWARQAQPGVRVVLLSAAGINAIDATGLDALRAATARLSADGQALALCGLKKQVIDRLERDGQWHTLAAHAHYRHEQAAIDALLEAHKHFDKT